MHINPDKITLTGQYFKATCKCPGCGREAVMQPIPKSQDVKYESGKDLSGNPIMGLVGLRTCPKCHMLIVAFARGTSSDTAIMREFWPESKYRNYSSGLEGKKVIAQALEEAIKACEYQLWRSAAVNTRRVVELICDDLGVRGDRLVDQVRNLKQTRMVPDVMVDAFDGLRLLGNDATHTVLSDYDDVGPEEATAALELVIELVRALYHHKVLLARLDALKKPPAP